jgi:DNA-binding response OmpR family regulator
MKNKILLVDDEPDIVTMLSRFFKSRGYQVLTAINGVDSLKQIEHNPDIILLDINMPGLDGLEVCERIRNHVSCPILFLTAKIEDADKVKGFGVGGDDYIVKPFSLVELEARVQAHLRRETRHNLKTQLKFSGELTINFSTRCLFCKGEQVMLAKKEFDIVELLSQNPGQIFDKERIYERVWGYDSEGDSSVVAEHIHRIRTKIALYTQNTYIETVWGCGYKWIR